MHTQDYDSEDLPLAALNLEEDEREMAEINGQTSIFGSMILLEPDELDGMESEEEMLENFSDDDANEAFLDDPDDEWDEDEDEELEFADEDDEDEGWDEWDEEGVTIEDSYDR